MKFEELRVIWNRQDQEPLFAINQEAMHDLIRRKSESVNRYIDWFELTMIVVPLLLAILLPIDAWREGGGWDQYVVAVICLLMGLATLTGRLRKRHRVVAFDQSVKAVAQRSLQKIDEHIKQLKLVFWGFHVPIAITAAIGLTLFTNTRTPLIWIGVLFVTAFSYWGMRRDIRKCLLPKKRDLETLRAKLVDSDDEFA